MIAAKKMLMGSAVPMEFVASSSAVIASSATITIAAPLGIKNGDLLFALIAADRSANDDLLTPPTGWTLAFSEGSNAVALHYKVAAGESVDYTFNAVSSTTTVGVLAVYRGLSGTAPLVGASPLSTDGILTAPSISPTDPGLLLAWYAARDTEDAIVSSGPSGMSLSGSEPDLAVGAWLYHLVDAPAEATGDKILTLSNQPGGDQRGGLVHFT